MQSGNSVGEFGIDFVLAGSQKKILEVGGWSYLAVKIRDSFKRLFKSLREEALTVRGKCYLTYD